MLHGLMGWEREAWKGQQLEKHLHAQPGWQNKGKPSISPFQMRGLRAQGGVRKGSRRAHHQEPTWCAEDMRTYRTGVHQQKLYKALSIKGLLPVGKALKRKDFKYSSLFSPKGAKVPGTPFTQPIWIAEKYCTRTRRLNAGRRSIPKENQHPPSPCRATEQG